MPSVHAGYKKGLASWPLFNILIHAIQTFFGSYPLALKYAVIDVIKSANVPVFCPLKVAAISENSLGTDTFTPVPNST